MYYEYMTTQYFVRFFYLFKTQGRIILGRTVLLLNSEFSIPYLLVSRFKNVFQHTSISVNNRGRAPSKYVNKLAIGFYFFIPEVKQYGRTGTKLTSFQNKKNDRLQIMFKHNLV
jgi:hypothetical protein